MTVLPVFAAAMLAATFADVATKIPSNAVGIAFEARPDAIAPSAEFLVRLLEPDNDQWVTRLRKWHFRGETSQDGWREAFIPFSDAYYMTWGNKKREHGSVKWIRFEFPDAASRERAKKFRYVLREEPPPDGDVPCVLPPGDPRGRVAVLDMGGGEGAHVLALLNGAGVPVRSVSASGLSDTNVFSRANTDLLVVPVSPRFPYGAKNSLRRFLKAGGALFTFGGYAFDDLGTDVRWPVSAEMDAGLPIPDMLNTRYGKAGDSVPQRDDAIGMFDPVFSITNACVCRSAKGQFFMPEDVDFALPCVTNGYFAAEMHALVGRGNPAVGKTAARRIPVLEAFDRFGRRRGPVLSVAVNYAGPYAGSLWAFTAHPHLFKDADPAADRLFLDIARRLLKGDMLASCSAAYDAYDPGENVSIRLKRFGTNGVARIFAAGKEVPACGLAAPAAPGLASVVCELEEDGRVSDRIETAIVVRGAKTKAPEVAFKGNSLSIDGRRGFVGGINTMGRIYSSDRENPLVWRDDFETMADYAMPIFRILHLSAYMRDGTTADADRPEHLVNRPEGASRRTDAIVAMANASGIVPFIVFHDWMPVDCGDANLRLQREWNAWWTGRYPSPEFSVMWDIQNEPKLSGSYSLENKDWKDLAARDSDRARAGIYANWIAENARGAREGNPSAIVTVGGDQDIASAEKQLSTDGLTFMNLHCYAAPEIFRGTLKLTDRRFEGKGFSVGEFGAVAMHDGRAYRGGTLATEEALDHYLKISFYTFGLGGAFVTAWAWKDFPESVFPWGLFHADMTPKPIAMAYRNILLALGGAEVEDAVPPVFLVLPDGFRIGGKTRTIHEGLRIAADALIALGVPFSVINEESLERLPPEAKVLVWPMAVSPKDESFGKVAAFVRRGGRLYVSGDFRWSFDRRPDRLSRPGELGLVADSAVPDDPFGGEARQVRASADGRVLWRVPAPELSGAAETAAAYAEFFAGPARDVRRAAMDGFPDGWTWMSLPLAGGGAAVTGVNSYGAPGGAIYQERRDGAGRLVALVCEGRHRGFAAKGGVCAFVSEDGLPLAESRSLLVLPLGASEAEIPASTRRREARTVEKRKGKWIDLETSAIRPGAPGKIRFQDDTHFDVRRIVVEGD